MYIRYLLLTVFLAFAGSVTAQIFDPVKWSYEVESVKGDEAVLKLTATIDAGWHLYSQYIEDGGPIPTTFTFKESGNFELLGKPKEAEGEKVFDPNFDMELKYFSHSAVFLQKIKIKNKGSFKIAGEVEFMVCDDERCLPPDFREFEFVIKSAAKADEKIETGSVEKSDEIKNPETSKHIDPAEMFSDADFGGGIENAVLDPVKWTAKLEKSGEKSYILKLDAAIDERWYIYSQYNQEGGPVSTAIEFDENSNIIVTDKAKEKADVVKEGHDKLFDMEITKFGHHATFDQAFSVKENSGKITGSIIYMVCDDERCIFPDAPLFTIDLDNETVSIGDAGLLATEMSELGNRKDFLINTVDLSNPVLQCGQTLETTSGSSLLKIFILGFLGGFVALLTPCVFPMIPLTVSFFTKGSEDKQKGLIRAVMYGFFILLIYVLLSIPFHLMDQVNPEILNEISTSVTLNVIFFVIFVVFAISFFGYFEITLPSGLVNKMDAKASSFGGMIGIFFMALTLALVSFSCTGPILGSLLAGSLSTDGGAWQLSSGMGGFGLALALPFALFAMFPQWLNRLPKSGGWLNSVKVVLGFVELALAIKFLSNADLVPQWGILKREIFFLSWILIGVALALYLFGKIKFPHDSPVRRLSFIRITLGLAVVAFVIYLIPGLTNTKYANLKLLSGFPPPMFYSIYPQESKCPLGLQCFKDYDEGLAYARKVNKPIMIDFTGWACVNCRKMEETVWVKSSIYDRLNNDFVLISLYVDDKRELPEDEQLIYETKTGQKKRIKTIGNKWATMQTETFVNNSQPYYVLLSPDEELLNHPVGYTPDESEYKEFLDCGLKAFQQKNGKQLSELNP